jgi:hypothetical protein
MGQAVLGQATLAQKARVIVAHQKKQGQALLALIQKSVACPKYGVNVAHPTTRTRPTIKVGTTEVGATIYVPAGFVSGVST